ncbi:MAG: trimethylamine methyltransferase family protein [Thermodesulfobacteriota bacterium]
MSIRTNLSEEQIIQFSFLSEGQKIKIYSETLEVLQYTGVDINHPHARYLLSENGCPKKGERVYIPSQLVKWALSRVPPITTIHSWDGSRRLRIENGRTYFGPGPTCPNFIDPWSGERRKYKREDASLVARVCDALPEIGFTMSLGSIHDVTDGLEEIYEFADMIQNTTKPVTAWCFTKEHCRDIHNIAIAIAGGEEKFKHRPNYIFYNEPISPLTCDFNALDKLIYCAENQIPQIFAPANTGGATVPATHASHLVITLAESLTGVVLSQLVKPGSCIVIGGTQSILDMRRMTFSYGSPELNILGAGLSEISEYLGLPVFSAAGCSDSKALDAQAAIEATLSINSAMLSGANLVHDVGFLSSGMTGSVQLLVMANEIISMSRYITRGMSITEETLAEEVINEVGPGGDYRNHEHTRKMSGKFWRSRLLQKSPEQATPDRSKSLRERVFDETRSIIETHQGPREKISNIVQEQINRILDSAEKKKQDNSP